MAEDERDASTNAMRQKNVEAATRAVRRVCLVPGPGRRYRDQLSTSRADSKDCAPTPRAASHASPGEREPENPQQLIDK